jgi:hypothetical protein
MARKPVEPSEPSTSPIEKPKEVKQQSEKPTEEVKQAKQQPLIVLHVNAPPQPPATVEEAIESHLREWGGSGGRLFGFNGQTGIFRTFDDDAQVLCGTRFVAQLQEAQKGVIRFNDDGPPTVIMVRLDELGAEVPDADELGADRSQWQVNSMSGELENPWKAQFAIPMMRFDAGKEIFCYVARGVVAMGATADLLGRYRCHPNRKAGLVPVIRIESGSYPSKRFGGRKPKPMLPIDDWVLPNGEKPPEPKKISFKDDLNDEIGF